MSSIRRQGFVWVSLVAAMVASGGCSGNDSKKNSTPETVGYTVPTGGGEVVLTLQSGNEITFDFPASASGKAIELTPRTSADIGWSDGRFTDVVELSPKGLTFSEPIVLRSKKNDLMVLHVKDANGTKSTPELLPLAANGQGVELRHFSALAFVPPGSSCDTSNGWRAQAASSACQDTGTATTRLSFECDALAYCVKVTASCCVGPERASDGCRIGDPHLSYLLEPAGAAAATYPWCSALNGSGGSGQGGAPQSSTLQGGAAQGGTVQTSVAAGGAIQTSAIQTSSAQGSSPAAGGATSTSSSPDSGSTSNIGGQSAQGGQGGMLVDSAAAGTFSNPTSASGGNSAAGGVSQNESGGAVTGGTSTLGAGGSGAGGTAAGGTATGAASSGGTNSNTTLSQVAAGGTSSSSAQSGPSASAGAAGWVGDLCLGFTSTALPSGVAALKGVAALSDDVAVAVGNSISGPSGDSAAVLTYDPDEAATWIVETPAYGALSAVSATGANSMIAVGSTGTVLAGSYANGAWTLTPIVGADAPTGNLAAVWAIDAQHFWVGGSSSAVYYYNGGTWEDHSIVTSGTLTVQGIWGTGANDLWVVQGFSGCPGSGPWHYSGGGWTAYSVCFVGNAIWGAAANDVWNVGYSKGAFSHFTGTQWSSADSYGLAVPMQLSAIRGRSSDRIWAVGLNGGVAAYDGAQWKMCNTGSTSDLSAVDVSATHVWAVGAAIVQRSE